MLLPDDAWREDGRGRVKRIDGRIDTELGDITREDDGRVEMRECIRGSGIGEIVRGDIDRLDGCDGSLARRGDTLLEDAHIRREGRLVSDGGWDTPKQGRYLRACLREAEDIINEEKDIALLDIAEVLRHRETRESDARTRSRGFVHLSEDHGGLVDDTRVLHLMVEVVSFAGTLTDSGHD